MKHRACDVFFAGVEIGEKEWPPETKKADVVERLKERHHVGLLASEPSGAAGLSFA